MQFSEKPRTGSLEVFKGYVGLSRVLESLAHGDTGPHSLRSAKYIRSFVTESNTALLSVLDDELNRAGVSFTFFEGLHAPGEVVEPLFENLVVATNEAERRQAARQLVEVLQQWDTNNTSDHRLAS